MVSRLKSLTPLPGVVRINFQHVTNIFLYLPVYHNDIFHTKTSRSHSICDSRPVQNVDTDKNEDDDNIMVASNDAVTDCDTLPNESCVNVDYNCIQNKNGSREDDVNGERHEGVSTIEENSGTTSVVIVDIQPTQTQILN